MPILYLLLTFSLSGTVIVGNVSDSCVHVRHCIVHFMMPWNMKLQRQTEVAPRKSTCTLTSSDFNLFYWASLVAQMVKNLPVNVGDLGLIPGLGRSPGEGHGNPSPYSCLENSKDRGVWRATVHGVTIGHDWTTEYTGINSTWLRIPCSWRDNQ